MGVVYEAYDREREETVAVKTLDRITPDLLLVLKNEFRAIQGFRHPNFVHVHELGEDRGRWYVIMELVRGVPFLQYVSHSAPERRRIGPDEETVIQRHDDAGAEATTEPVDRPEKPPHFDADRLRATLLQVVDGLTDLHAAGKLHRDIKPANIMVTEQGKVFLLDLGLVSDARQAAPAAGDIFGTSAYLPPEVFQGAAPAPSADWYALGVTLYQALTQRRPFVGNRREILEQKLFSGPPLRPSQVAPAVDPVLESLCMRLLDTDPAQRPGGAEIRQLLSGRRVNKTGPMQVTFVGRNRELGMLKNVYESVGGDTASIVYVEGESGVGKSALASHFLESLSQQPRTPLLLRSRCHVGESVPYNAIDGLIDSLSSHLATLSEEDLESLLTKQLVPLAQLFPVLRRGPLASLAQSPVANVGSALRNDAFRALRVLVNRLSAKRPLVAWIDDFQRADSDSLALLHELFRPAERVALLIVATVRLGEQTRDRGQWPEGPTIRLKGLDTDEAEALIETLLGSHGSDRAVTQNIVQAASGHPLFIAELSRRAAQGGSVSELALDAALWDRVSRLPPEPRRLLEFAATSSSPLPLSVVVEATSLERSKVVTAVEQLVEEGLAQTSGLRRTDVFDCYHDRIRESVLNKLASSALRERHALLAAAFENVARHEHEQLITHWEGAGDKERAAAHALEAAQAAEAALAFSRAAHLYSKAIALRGEERSSRETWERLATALANAGRGLQSGEAFERAARMADREQRVDLKLKAMDQHMRAANHATGVRIMTEVLKAIGERVPRGQFATLLAYVWQEILLSIRGLRFKIRDSATVSPQLLRRVDLCAIASQGFGFVDQLRYVYFHTRSLRFALRAGEPRRLVRGLSMHALGYAFTGTKTRHKFERLIRQVREQLLDPVGDPDLSIWSDMFWAGGVHQYGEYVKSRDTLLRGLHELKDKPGYAWELDSLKIFLLEAFHYLGELKELQEYHTMFLDDAKARGNRFARLSATTGLCNATWLVKGQPAEARSQLEQIVSDLMVGAVEMQDYYANYALANIDLYEGDAERAVSRMERRVPFFSRLVTQNIASIRIDANFTHARTLLLRAWRYPDKRKADVARAMRLAKKLRSERQGWAYAYATLIEACAQNLVGNEASTISLLSEAMHRFDAIEMKWHAAATRRALSERVGGDESVSLRRHCDAWASRNLVAEPERLLAMLVPGLIDPN